MEAIELIEIVTCGEDTRTQFKQSQDITNAKSLAGEMVAFSNSKGGRILIGVDDNSSVVGLAPIDIRRLNQLISNTATNNVRPPINPETENITIGDKLVMVVSISEGISKPYSDNEGTTWVKSGSDKRRVTSREELQRMFQSSHLIQADEIPVEGTSLTDIDIDHFKNYFERQYGTSLEEALGKDNITLDNLFQNMGLAQDSRICLAGLMIFGINPQRYRPAFIVKAVSFIGNDATGDKYRDSQDITGCIRELHQESMSFLTRNLRRIQGEKNFNSEGDLEIPISALEELIANMLLHRDYFISAPWRIMIFENRIEIISPGALPNNLTIENIRNGVSNFRNSRMVNFATNGNELPFRGIGTGIRRALAAVPNIEFESDQDRNLFIVRIPRNQNI